MYFRGDNLDLRENNNRDLNFQVIDWFASDEVTEEEYIGKDKKTHTKRNCEYCIRLFGSTIEGYSVSANVYGYTPHFYIKVPDIYYDEQYRVKQVMDSLISKMNTKYKKIKTYKLIMMKDIWGFSNNKKCPFIKIIFKDLSSMNTCVKIIKDESLNNVSFKDKLYESNIPPFLRFIHKNEIKPAGWVTIKSNNYDVNLEEDSKTTCQIDVDVNDWRKVHYLNSEKMAPFIIASIDGEMTSSHGDFPLAKKNYKKLSQEIYENYSKNEKQLRSESSDVLEQLINEMLNKAFHNYESEYDISNIYTKDNEKPSFRVINNISKKIANILTGKETYGILSLDIINILFSELENIDTDVSEQSIYSLICDSFADDRKELESEISKTYTISNKKPSKKVLYNVACRSYKVIKKLIYCLRKILKDDDICKILSNTENKVSQSTLDESHRLIDMYNNQIIALFRNNLPELDDSKETIIMRMLNIMDNYFPPVGGDEIIQLGTSIQRYGEKEPYLKHIVTLDTCSSIDGIIVEACKTEEELILKWIEFIMKLDPDIITGYNIFGFDFAYIWDRACELGITDENNILDDPIFMGRIKSLPSKLEIKKLASSALGDNTLSYITMHGRVLTDLLKVIQRDHNLVSYKLDNVAEHFMNDSIVDIINNNNKSTTLKVKGIHTIVNGSYITIDYNSNSPDKHYKNEKYMVLDVNKELSLITINKFIKKELLFNEHNSKIKWQLAKDDVSPKDIFQFQRENADKRAVIAKYCVQDCTLCLNIINKLDIVTNNMGMANVCYVPLSFIFLRGQGIKIFSLVSKECKQEDFLIPLIKHEREEVIKNKQDKGLDYDFKPWIGNQKITRFEPDEDDNDVAGDDGYEGAIVLKPQPDIYLENPVSVLDYASLYPSSMISENLSLDSIILPNSIYEGDNGIEELKKLGYSYVDIEYDTFKWKDPKVKTQGKIKSGTKTVRYAQPPNEEKSIIPRILMKLLKARKDTRGKIKTVTDPFQKSVLDGLQLAYKLTANSLYGQIGAKTSPIYMKDIAASTTATGRKLLYLAKEKTEEYYKDAKIVYGDSVLADTPLLLLNVKDNKIEIKQIDDLYDGNWLPYEQFKMEDSNRKNKQQQSNEKYMIYTSNGWSKINRVIRHKTTKKIYRVTTHSSVVDVTEDHSLLDDNLNILKPTEIDTNTQLLHNYPQFNINRNQIHLSDILDYKIEDKDINIKKAYIYGFFYGDGSCGYYKCPSGNKYSWALNNSDSDLIIILQSLLYEVYNEEFTINDTLKSSGVYKLVPTKNVRKYVNEYRNIFYNKDKYKIIPKDILNEDYETKYSFLCGYYCADGYKCKNSKSKNIILTNKGKIGTSMLNYLAKSIGFNVSLNTRNDKPNVFKLTCSTNKLRKNERSVKKIDYLKTISNDDYVYDIETVTGNFNVGFPLIVKNTDSIFINFNPKDEHGNPIKNKAALAKSIEMGLEVEKYIQQFLKKPHKLEYEKTFWPFILFSKKRYIGNKYETDIEDYKQTSMGIVLKRRDNADIVKHIYGGVIDIIMNQHNLEKSIEFCRNECRKLLDGKFNMDLLVITKSLRGFYKNPQQIAHKVLADRMGIREPGNKPKSNDRIPFVYIEHKELKGAKVLQGDKIEHPDYIKQNNIKPDYKFYITNQIMKPVGQIYALTVETLSGFKYDSEYYDRKYKEYLNKYDCPIKASNKVRDIKYNDASDIIFSEILRIANNRKNKVREITDFFQIKS